MVNWTHEYQGRNLGRRESYAFDFPAVAELKDKRWTWVFMFAEGFWSDRGSHSNEGENSYELHDLGLTFGVMHT